MNATATVAPDRPAAEEFMQMAALLVALGAMVPVLRVSITFSGGTPSVNSFSSVRTDLLAGNITVTDNGTGDTSITVASGSFPAPATRAAVALNDAAGTNRAPSASPISNGVRVVTTNSAGSAADIAFTVEIF